MIKLIKRKKINKSNDNQKTLIFINEKSIRIQREIRNRRFFGTISKVLKKIEFVSFGNVLIERLK
jgi:hypothetical protein